MSLDTEALRSSFALVVERAPDVTARFYEVLFERYPQTRPMFGKQRPVRAQEQMLTQALAAVIDHLEDANWLGDTLMALGEKHVGYGVTREMYDWVGECLLVTLADIAGDAWDERLHTAWSDAYGAISGLMLAGAERQAAE